MESLLDFFKIAADETRLRILMLLTQGDFYVCEICGILKLSQPKVSKHLIKLKDKKFVKSKQMGKYMRYSLNVENKTIFDFLSQIITDLEEYPELYEDSMRIPIKEKYFNRCQESKNETD